VKDQDIVMIGQQAWDLGIGSNAHNIAAEFALHNRVLYVNPPLDVKTLLTCWKEAKVRKRLRGILGLQEKISQVNKNLWVYTPGFLALSINWLPSQLLFRFFNGLNNALFSHSIKHAAKVLGMKQFVLFNDNLMFLGLQQKERLKPQKYIYYLRDYLICQEYFKKHGPWAEGQLMRTADVVMTNSSFLANYAAKGNPQAYEVGQGCELEIFDPRADYPQPGDLASLPSPIVGYVGNLTAERLDINLLMKLALAKPHWSFALVGFEDQAFADSPLHKIHNVHFLGPKAPAQLPAYIANFDICMNPQLVNDLTIGNYPRKVDEYLAMGKPVVATRTEAMQMFDGHVYLGLTAADYVALLDQALAEHTPARREKNIAFARSHSWQASVATMYATLERSRYREPADYQVEY
jgi:glycosyltransferase involved in cell wall biosynthesis